jgi:hypothetical protein
MASKADTSAEELEEDALVWCDSAPPPPGEEDYAKATEVRELPPNLLELLKKGDDEGAVDADLADVADLANLIVSSRMPTAPVSGVVPKGEAEQEARVAPPPARLPRPEIPPPASVAPRRSLSLADVSSNVLFAGLVFGVVIVYLVLLIALR